MRTCVTLLPVPLQLPYDPASLQYRWAAAELASVNRTDTPWLVVLMHGSPRTTYGEGWGLWKVGRGCVVVLLGCW